MDSARQIFLICSRLCIPTAMALVKALTVHPLDHWSFPSCFSCLSFLFKWQTISFVGNRSDNATFLKTLWWFHAAHGTVSRLCTQHPRAFRAAQPAAWASFLPTPHMPSALVTPKCWPPPDVPSHAISASDVQTPLHWPNSQPWLHVPAEMSQPEAFPASPPLKQSSPERQHQHHWETC